MQMTALRRRRHLRRAERPVLRGEPPRARNRGRQSHGVSGRRAKALYCPLNPSAAGPALQQGC